MTTDSEERAEETWGGKQASEGKRRQSREAQFRCQTSPSVCHSLPWWTTNTEYLLPQKKQWCKSIAPDIQLRAKLQEETQDSAPSHSTEGKGTPATKTQDLSSIPRWWKEKANSPKLSTYHSYTHIIAHACTHTSI